MFASPSSRHKVRKHIEELVLLCYKYSQIISTCLNLDVKLKQALLELVQHFRHSRLGPVPLVFNGNLSSDTNLANKPVQEIENLNKEYG